VRPWTDRATPACALLADASPSIVLGPADHDRLSRFGTASGARPLVLAAYSDPCVDQLLVQAAHDVVSAGGDRLGPQAENWLGRRNGCVRAARPS